MANRKRTLVDISSEVCRQLREIKHQQKRMGKPVPSIPYLVDAAIKKGLPALRAELSDKPCSS